MVTLHNGNARQSELDYNNLDTSSDTLGTSTPVTISGSHTDTYALGANLQAVTEGTDGTIYAGILGSGGSYVVKCSSNCAASASNWSDAGTQPWENVDTAWLLLVPLPSSSILSVRFGVGTTFSPNRLDSSIYNAASSTWSATSTIDSNCPANTTYDGHFGAAVNLNSKNIYFAYACNVNNFNGTAKGDIRTQIFSAASSTWTQEANVETSSTLGITGTKLGLDINTGNVYVVYSARTTRGTATTANVYYKISTSTTMQTWGSIQGPVNNTTTDIYGLRIDGMDADRLFASWVDGPNSSLEGATIATFAKTTLTEAAYRFFQNQDSAQVGIPFAPTNASSLIPMAGNPFRLRMLIAVGGTGIDISSRNFKLQYATSTAGGCDTGFSGETYSDVGTATSSAISFYNNPTPANGTALTANAQDPTDGTNVIVNQTYVEQNTFSDDIAKILAGQDGKWDFSLKNNTAASGQTFCFRMVNSDGSLLNSYNNVAEAQVDVAPTITNLSLNGGNNITLIEGTTTLIKATGTVSDSNGFADIYSITGKAYRTGVGSSCSADNNNCYIGTGANCSINNCAGTSCTAECDYNIWYFAEPTDSGTPWAGDSWSTLMQASDTVGSGVTATTTGGSLLSLLALRTTSTINYGTFVSGQSMATLTATSVITSSGNAAMNVNVYGTNMTAGAQSIAVGQQHFATSSLAYASGTTLLANPGSTIAINMSKPTSTTNAPTSTFYWGIAIPSPQPAGTYTGFNSFVGVLHSLPWP